MTSEKAFKTMSISGGTNIAIGVIILVSGIALGVISIVMGAKLLNDKKGLTF